jgi:hypothetical protein
LSGIAGNLTSRGVLAGRPGDNPLYHQVSVGAAGYRRGVIDTPALPPPPAAAWLASLRSARTRRAYAADLLAWRSWLAERGLEVLAARRV